MRSGSPGGRRCDRARLARAGGALPRRARSCRLSLGAPLGPVRGPRWRRLSRARGRAAGQRRTEAHMRGLKDIDYVLAKLAFMRNERIWPNGLRYLWTDAFGVVLLASLYAELREKKYLDEAERVVAEVMRVLGRKRGIRIGEESDRDGQYFHYLAMWLFALHVLGRFKPEYREQGVRLAHDIHRPFVVAGRGVIWKMKEDLSGPYPGYGFGALDAFDGYVSYRL